MQTKLTSQGVSRGKLRPRWRVRSAIAIGASLVAGVAVLAQPASAELSGVGSLSGGATADSTPNLADGSDTGRSAVDNLTRSRSPVFTGLVEQAGARVQLLVDGAVEDTATAFGDAYEVRASNLAPGRHRVAARIAGVVSDELVVRVDTARPRVSGLHATPDPFHLNGTRPLRVSFRVNEGVDVQGAIFRSGRNVKVLGSRRLAAAGTLILVWNATDNGDRSVVRAGLYAFRVILIDVAGNRTTIRTPIQVIR
jgi:large repetitive protein